MGLKARSHPSGVRLASVGDEVFRVFLSVECNSRSLLWIRLTKVLAAAALSTPLEAVSAQRPPAMKQDKSVPAAIFSMWIGIFASMARYFRGLR
jgi:hypothetical protein